MKLWKRKVKRKPLDSEELPDQLWLRYYWLLIQSMEHDRKVRLMSIRLSRKYNKEQPWII